jgi:hypothetical protein
MTFQHIPNKGLGWDTIIVPLYQIYPKEWTKSGRVGATKPQLFKHQFKYAKRKKMIKSYQGPKNLMNVFNVFNSALESVLSVGGPA